MPTGFSGLTDTFIAAMLRAHASIGGQAEVIRMELNREQVPNGMPGWAAGLVRYDESAVPFTSPQEARRAGAALSDLYEQYVKETTGKVVTDELKQRHRDDAGFAAAFFAALGTAGAQASSGDAAGARQGPAAGGGARPYAGEGLARGRAGAVPSLRVTGAYA